MNSLRHLLACLPARGAASERNCCKIERRNERMDCSRLFLARCVDAFQQFLFTKFSQEGNSTNEDMIEKEMSLFLSLLI